LYIQRLFFSVFSSTDIYINEQPTTTSGKCDGFCCIK
jgi:hypothetical protein